MAIFFPTLHVGKTGSSEDRAHSGESMQSNRNEEGCRLCPPEPMAAHGHVNGWREAPGWSEAEGLWRQQPTCHLVQQKGPRGHSGAEPPQKSPLRSKLLPVLGNPYRRRPSGVQTGEKSAIRTGEALLVYKPGRSRDNRASARRRRQVGCALQNRLAPLDRLAPVARLLNPSQLRYSPFPGHTAHLRGLCPRMTPAAPGLPIPLRYIPASAVALRRDFLGS